MGWFDKDGKLHPLFKSPAQGASTSVWAATSPALAGKGGVYLEDCNIAASGESTPAHMGVAAHAVDPVAAKRLCMSEEMTAPWRKRAAK